MSLLKEPSISSEAWRSTNISLLRTKKRIKSISDPSLSRLVGTLTQPLQEERRKSIAVFNTMCILQFPLFNLAFAYAPRCSRLRHICLSCATVRGWFLDGN
jgi:hypothetical protein